jgi:hypothetical protein
LSQITGIAHLTPTPYFESFWQLRRDHSISWILVVGLEKSLARWRVRLQVSRQLTPLSR